MTIFCLAVWVHPVVRPHSSQQCCGQKSTHYYLFAQNLILFVVGGEGSLVLLVSLEIGKVPTLLTFIVANPI